MTLTGDDGLIGGNTLLKIQKQKQQTYGRMYEYMLFNWINLHD